jgi:hypothetical protein
LAQVFWGNGRACMRSSPGANGPGKDDGSWRPGDTRDLAIGAYKAMFASTSCSPMTGAQLARELGTLPELLRRREPELWAWVMRAHRNFRRMRSRDGEEVLLAGDPRVIDLEWRQALSIRLPQEYWDLCMGQEVYRRWKHVPSFKATVEGQLQPRKGR